MRLEPGSPAYMRLHYEVTRARGRAMTHPCAECGAVEGKREWSNISGDYLGVDDFRVLCVSCHRSADQRRVHDEREDHAWTPTPYESSRCQICGNRRRQRGHQRIMADPARAARLREQNRAAVKRYRERKAARA